MFQKTAIHVTFFLVSLFGVSSGISAQSAGFFIETGQVVPFVFNSFSKLENGITYTDWTRIRVQAQDANLDFDTLGWTLSFRALTPIIQGDDPLNTLPLNTIRISTADNSPVPPQFNPTPGFIDLTAGYQALATTIPAFHIPNTTAPGPEQTILDISYECGGNNSGCPGAVNCNRLFGQTPDLYTVDIEVLFTVY